MSQSRPAKPSTSNQRPAVKMLPSSSAIQNHPDSAGDQKPEPTTFNDYHLLAAFEPALKNNILKFAPSSKKDVHLASFIQPVKMNRKDPWAIRKKEEEERSRAHELKLKSEFGSKDDYGSMQDPSSIHPSNPTLRPFRDDSLIAPGPSPQQRFKNPASKKKIKQVFIAADQSARMLKKEEYQSWLLEDASTSGERWVGRYESAGAGSGSTSSAIPKTLHQTSQPAPNDASNYVIFRLRGDTFHVSPCHRFYRFTQRPAYDTLGAEEAEAAYEKMQKPTTKEDVGRWFMRRRGAASGSSASVSSPAERDSVKRDPDFKPSIFDESKIAFNSRPGRPQVEAVSVFGGRKGKFTAVHGGSKLRGEEDEDVKPQLGQDGDFDEVDYNEEFADDEEGAGNLNDEAMEEDELKELEERMKREMLAAGRAGDEDRDKEAVDLDTDDLIKEKDDLTKEGKAVKKLLMRKTDNEVYDSDEDVKNPYASEEDESDFEEVIPPSIAAPAGSPPDLPINPRSETPVPGSGASQGNPSVSAARNLMKDKLSLSRSSTVVKLEDPSGAPSRPGTPGPTGSSRAISPRPVNGSNLILGIGKTSSRAGSPQPPSKPSQGRADSPPAASPKPPTSSTFGTPSGAKRKHPGGAASKEKRQNQGSAPGSPSTAKDSPPPMGWLTEEEVIKVLRVRSMSTKELLAHFKLKLKDDRNRTAVFRIITVIATMSGGQLVLKPGI